MTSVPPRVEAPSGAEFARLEGLVTWMLERPRPSRHMVNETDLIAAAADLPARGGLALFGETRPPAPPRPPLPLALPFRAEISSAASRYRLDNHLLAAMVEVESSFDPRVVSPRGAMGLMQIMPSIAAIHGVTDPFDPASNLDVGARHFSLLLRQFHGDVELALAAYNAGPAAVTRFGGVPPYRETSRYVEKVMARYARRDLDADREGLAGAELELRSAG